MKSKPQVHDPLRDELQRGRRLFRALSGGEHWCCAAAVFIAAWAASAGSSPAQVRDSLPVRTISEVAVRNDSLFVKGETYSIREKAPSDFMFSALLGFSQLHGDVNDGSTFPGASRPWLWSLNFPVLFRIAESDLPVLDEVRFLLRGGLHFSRIQGDYPGYSVTNWVTNAYLSAQMDFLRFAGLEWKVQPFFYAGVGYLWHSPNIDNVSERYRIMEEFRNGGGDHSASWLVGAGLSWRVTPNIDLVASWDKTFTFTDALDHFASRLNDNYAGISIGLRFSFGIAAVDTVAETYELVSYHPPTAMPEHCGLLDKLQGDCSGRRSLSFEALSSDEKEKYLELRDEDSDEDGISDADELYIFGTDSEKDDTDGDGLKDAEEIVGILSHEALGAYRVCGVAGITMRRMREILETGGATRLVITSPVRKDSDGDGIDDFTEICFTNTNPCAYDTDGDGLGDYLESFSLNTDPRNPDSDGDGLSDCDELLVRHTNPLLRDTDFDGISDGRDAEGGVSRDMPISEALCREGMSIDPKIFFSSGSWEIESRSRESLLDIYEFLFRNPSSVVEIVGYADADPISERSVYGRRSARKAGDRNLALSELRARALYNWLVAQRVPPRRLSVTAGGELPGASAEQKRLNRRVEVVVKKCR